MCTLSFDLCTPDWPVKGNYLHCFSYFVYLSFPLLQQPGEYQTFWKSDVDRNGQTGRNVEVEMKEKMGGVMLGCFQGRNKLDAKVSLTLKFLQNSCCSFITTQTSFIFTTEPCCFLFPHYWFVDPSQKPQGTKGKMGKFSGKILYYRCEYFRWFSHSSCINTGIYYKILFNTCHICLFPLKLFIVNLKENWNKLYFFLSK